jgi:plasmid maintenance system antidote protein VapI
MTNKPLIERLEQKYANDPEYIAGGLALKVTEEMLQILRDKGKNQTWLAEQMGVSKAHISRILNAQPNMTLFTVAKIAIALDTKANVSLAVESELGIHTKLTSSEDVEPNIDRQNVIVASNGCAIYEFAIA